MTVHRRYYTQKYHHGEPIILELATRNNLDLYRPIDVLMIYFSWGTVRIQLQQHQKAIWKLGTAIWWWSRFTGTRTTFTYLSIQLQLLYLQKNKDTEKIQKIFPENKCVCICDATHARTCTERETHFRWPKLSSWGQDVRLEPKFSNSIHIYLAPIICFSLKKNILPK